MDDVIVWVQYQEKQLPDSKLFHSVHDAREAIIRFWLDNDGEVVGVYRVVLGSMSELHLVIEDGNLYLREEEAAN